MGLAGILFSPKHPVVYNAPCCLGNKLPAGATIWQTCQFCQSWWFTSFLCIEALAGIMCWICYVRCNTVVN